MALLRPGQTAPMESFRSPGRSRGIRSSCSTSSPRRKEADHMTHLTPTRLLVAVCISLASAAPAASPAAPRPKPPGGTLAGGPYKLVAADFTGDGKIDLAMAYLQIGAVTIEQGNGKGEFTNLGILSGAKATSDDLKGVSNITA